MNIADSADCDFTVWREICDCPGRLEELKNEYILLLKTNKYDHFNWYILGIMYYTEKDFFRAAKCFTNCINMDKTVKKYFLGLAFSLRHMGKYEECDYILFNLNKLMRGGQ